MIYFTSDQHFGHENIIRFESRPYKNVSQMDSTLIKNFNKVVSENDIAYILGDFSLRGSGHLQYYENIMKKLNGHKILILGNHDRLKPFDYIELGFEGVHTNLEINIENRDLALFHDPCYSICYKDRICLCGHVHSLFKSIGNVINVGVDVWDLTPVSWPRIKEEIGILGGKNATIFSFEIEKERHKRRNL